MYIFLYLKGNPEEPKCGFSNAVVQIMRMHDVKYDAHDVLQDERIRQGKYFIIIYIDLKNKKQILNAVF